RPPPPGPPAPPPPPPPAPPPGGEVVYAGTTSEHRLIEGREIAEREGLTIVPPFDHPDIIAGQGTVGLEIVEQLPDVAHVAVPVGGGGLAAGVTTAVATLRPDARITGVEPASAAAFRAAVEVGHPVRMESCESIADGLLPLSVGTVTFNHLRGRADAVVVSEDAIAAATLWLHSEGVMAEPSGAVTTAAVRTGRLRASGPVVLVVSGGNADPDVIASLEGFHH
ncbi:MAG: pyridoxal-phosphate dependent enzyme, partial [Gemmatimonadales bacterium]